MAPAASPLWWYPSGSSDPRGSYEPRQYAPSGYGQQRERGREEQDERGFPQRLREIGREMRRGVKRVFRAPKGYKRSDERIREEVCDRLANQDDFDPSDIEVQVSNAEVTLTGSVATRPDKFRAEEIADDVGGVEDVHNQLRVQRRRETARAETTRRSREGAQTAGEAGRDNNARP